MLKKLFTQLKLITDKGLLHIFSGSFLTKFVGMFGSIFLVRILTKDEFGKVGYIENIFGYFYIFAGLGLNNALFRFVILSKTIEKKYSYYRYVIERSLIINLILVVIGCLFSFIYPHPAEFSSIGVFLMIYMVLLPFQSLCENNLAMFRVMFENKRYAIYSFLLSTILIGTRLILSYLFHMVGTIVSPVIIYMIFAFLLTFLVYKLYFKKIQYKQSLTKQEKITTIKYAIQYMITNGIWVIFMLNDIYMLGRFGGSSALVADYKVAYTIPGNLAIISTAIGIFVSPYFVKHENDKKWVWKNFKKVFGINALCMFGFIVILFIFAEPIVLLLYGKKYLNIVGIMRLLLIVAFANNGLRFTCANLLAAMGQIKYNMIVSFLGVSLQVLINIWVIPRYGSYGLSYTSIFIYSLMAITLFVVFVKKYRDKDNNRVKIE